MRDRGTTRTGVLLALLVGILALAAVTPAVAVAEWKSAAASIVDPSGTGYVPLLNVRVANHAVNDTSPVTRAEFSDDAVSWYTLPYTGEPCDWVLAGGSGAKTLWVRFVAADDTVSPIVRADVRVDAGGPTTTARTAAAGAGGRMTFSYTVRDAGSPHVSAELVIRGRGVTRRRPLGLVPTGRHTARLRCSLPRGTYRWSVEATDLAGWAQETRVSAVLSVR
jgi:hypothetical protein